MNALHENHSHCVRNGLQTVVCADKSKVVFFPGAELLSLRHLSLTCFSTHGGKICNSGAMEHGDLLFIHSCQSDRSNGVYTFLMSLSRAGLTLYIDCCKASHHGSYKIEIEFWMCFFIQTFWRTEIKVSFDCHLFSFRPRAYRDSFDYPGNWYRWE